MGERQAKGRPGEGGGEDTKTPATAFPCPTQPHFPNLQPRNELHTVTDLHTEVGTSSVTWWNQPCHLAHGMTGDGAGVGRTQ